jgi:anti-sigma regulatory factor (Ser/Thr protein kinase)
MAYVPKSITIVIPRLTGKLDYLRETLVEFLNGNTIDEGPVSRIELSVYEAVVNIIEHSSPAYSDKEIGIECGILDHQVAITITSYGDKFDVTKATLPDIEKHYKSGKTRGLGIYFIMTLMDRVEYSYDTINMMSTLRMFKKV